MHEIRFQVRREGGTDVRVVRATEGSTLLEPALEAGLPIARACDGASLCARCGLRILENPASLTGEAREEKRAKSRNRVPEEERLSCQARIRGPLLATAGYW